VLHLPNGRQFTIVADNLSDVNGYVGAVRLNGRPVSRAFIRHEEIMAGGELHFSMQAQPNKSWAQSRSSRPYSLSVALH
jgi:putative alpha-1,2-mannosidase